MGCEDCKIVYSRCERKQKSQERVFLQSMVVICQIDMLDKKLGCLCLKWGTDDAVDHSLM